jgi:hypothetical protein
LRKCLYFNWIRTPARVGGKTGARGRGPGAGPWEALRECPRWAMAMRGAKGLCNGSS